MARYLARVSSDLHYEADEPLNAEQLLTIANRSGTYLRVGAVEGLEEDITVSFDKAYVNDLAHHHDARYDRCGPDFRQSRDGIGPIDE
jgi:hypothetical protein